MDFWVYSDNVLDEDRVNPTGPQKRVEAFLHNADASDPSLIVRGEPLTQHLPIVIFAHLHII